MVVSIHSTWQTSIHELLIVINICKPKAQKLMVKLCLLLLVRVYLSLTQGIDVISMLLVLLSHLRWLRAVRVKRDVWK